jgi:hypothetical protein
MHNASASKTDQLLNCQYWASPFVCPPGGDTQNIYARFGTAFHKCTEMHLLGGTVLIKAIAEKYDVNVNKLQNYYDRWVIVINKMFAQNPHWNQAIKHVERKMAYDPFKDEGRFLLSKEDRDYSEKRSTELPGTADLALVCDGYDGELVVIDWKTGQSSYDAENNGQLKSLSLSLSRIYNKLHISVRVFIIRIDDELVESNEAFLEPKVLEIHRKKLKGGLKLAMLPYPPMKIGPDCKYCNALEVCPSQQDPFSVVEYDMLDAEEVGFIYDRILAAEKLLQKKRARINQYIASNGPVPRDNGKWLTLKKVTKENISKASIVRALGDIKGHEFIDELRNKGVIEESTEERIISVNDPNAKNQK